MVTAASDRRMRRRGGRRQKPGTTPADVGTALRDAREATGISLVEIQDRTGVPLAQLEALEAGDLSRFSDLRSARTAVRRYSDLVELDGDDFTSVIEDHWGTALAGFNDTGAAAGPMRPTGTAPRASTSTNRSSAGHLSRYPGDGTHLRAFTQTDEVPGVRRAELPAGNGHGDHGAMHATGAFPAVAPGVRATACRPADPARCHLGHGHRARRGPRRRWPSSTTTPSSWRTSTSCTRSTPPSPSGAGGEPHDPGNDPCTPGTFVSGVADQYRRRQRHGVGPGVELLRGGRRVGAVLDRGPHPAELLPGVRGHAPGGSGQGVQPRQRATDGQHERLAR